MIWLTSDLHLGHDREFVWGARGFNNVQEMNETIIKNYNEVIEKDDDVYILGDLMLGDNNVGVECLRQLGGKIHIVWGNHDGAKRRELYTQLPNFVEGAAAIELKYRKYHFYLSHYPTLTGNLENESLKQMTLNLFGHTHQQTNFYEDRPYMFHVGLDSHDCRPICLDDVIDEMIAKVEECKTFL